MRVVHVTHGVVPYQTPLFNAIGSRMDLHVVYMSPPSTGTSEGTWSSFSDPWGAAPTFDHSYAPGRSISILSLDFLATLPRRLGPLLDRLKPEAASVYSWSLGCASAVSWAQRHDVASMMWTESSEWSGLLRDPVSNAYRRRLIRLCDAHLTVGPAARAYALKLGAREGTCVEACLPSTRPVAESRTRREVRGRRPLRILWVGRLVDRKRPQLAVEAFSRAVGEMGDATLTIVGDGPLESRVRKAASRATGPVEVLGRVDGDELAAVYDRHDVLIVTSVREVWGLVVNEALERGLYVISSDQVGSALSLLENPTGRIVRADDVEGFAGALKEAIATPRSRTVDASPRRIGECTVDAFADSYVRAMNLAVTRHADGVRASIAGG